MAGLSHQLKDSSGTLCATGLILFQILKKYFFTIVWDEPKTRRHVNLAQRTSAPIQKLVIFIRVFRKLDHSGNIVRILLGLKFIFVNF